MVTTGEIERRIEEADAARSAKRTAAAKRVGELAQLRAEFVDKVDDLERELGDVLAESSDVIGIDELAKYTDVPAADLSQWHNNRKTTRTRRKRSTASTSGAKTGAAQAPSLAKTAPVDQTSALPELAEPRTAGGTSAGNPQSVT